MSSVESVGRFSDKFIFLQLVFQPTREPEVEIEKVLERAGISYGFKKLVYGKTTFCINVGHNSISLRDLENDPAVAAVEEISEERPPAFLVNYQGAVEAGKIAAKGIQAVTRRQIDEGWWMKGSRVRFATQCKGQDRV